MRKRRSDAGIKRPGSPSVPDVHITFRINPERDKAAWDMLQHYLNQGYAPRTVWLWALLNASGVPTEGMTAPSNGLPQASLDYLRDQIIEYLDSHQLVVAREETSEEKPRGKVAKEDRNFIRRMLSGFDSSDEDDED